VTSYIVDFGCCLPFGHNLQCVNLYAEKEKEKGRKTISVVCGRIKKFNIVKQRDDFNFSLPTLYNNLLVDSESSTLKRLMLKLRVKLFDIYDFTHYLVSGFNSSATQKKANRAIKKLFKSYDISANDHIVIPSGEYFGVKALFLYLSKLDVDKRPSVHIRFIGVLEHRHSFLFNSLDELIKLINSNYQKVTIGGEVPNYARYLNSVMSNIEVEAEPYPLPIKSDVSVYKRSDGLNILLPGTNRDDKGYFELQNLSKELLFQFPNAKLIIQDLKEWDPNFSKKYQDKLRSLANVELVDAILTREEMESLYERADIILLPYDPNVYNFRGSAIHYEAMLNKKPVIVRKGVGFEEEVNKWGSGWVFETKKDLYDRLEKFIDMPDEAINSMLEKAVKSYLEEQS